MTSAWKRTALGLTLLATLALTTTACGGGNGGGGGGPTLTPTRTPTRTLRPGEPTFTRTPSPVPPTPIPTATPAQVVPSPGGTDIVAAIRSAPPGAVVAVPAGVYPAFTLTAGDLSGPLTILADTNGTITGQPAGSVVINAAGRSSAAITLEGVSDLILDGFTVRGGTVAGIEVRDSSAISIRNFIARDNERDGLRVVRSSDVRLWNNLVYNNVGIGVFVLGSTGVQVINHTFHNNGGGGLVLGDSLLPSTGVFLRNNILVGNRAPGMFADPTTTDVDANFNLNRDGYQPAELAGADDLTVDPFWSSPGTDNGFRIPGTNDECLGGSEVMDAGDDALDPELLDLLARRTTQTDNKPDCIGAGCCPPGCIPGSFDLECAKIGRPDLGYHYEIR